MAERLTPELQLERWVAGSPECPNTRGECCPDFSCCLGASAMAPLHERKAFAQGDECTREHMCSGFLTRALLGDDGDDLLPVVVMS